MSFHGFLGEGQYISSGINDRSNILSLLSLEKSSFMLQEKTSLLLQNIFSVPLNLGKSLSC